MRLLGVELTRLRWRRAVLVLVVAAVAIPALILGAVAWDTRPVSAAEVAAAEEQAAAERDQPYIQDELERCLEDPEQYGGSVDSDDPQVQCEEMILPRAQWFLFRQPLDVEQQLQDTGSAVPVLLFVLLLTSAASAALVFYLVRRLASIEHAGPSSPSAIGLLRARSSVVHY